MARVKVRHLVGKRGRRGWRWYWQPSAALAKEGWRPIRLQGDQAEILAQAEKLNAELDAWRAAGGGPRKPGTYIRPGTLAALIRAFQASPRYERLSATTKRDYAYHLRRLEAWGGTHLLAGITPAVVQKLYEALLPKSHAVANARIRVLRLLLSHGRRVGMVGENAARSPGLIGQKGRVRIYTAAEEAALIAAADASGRPSIGDAVMMGCDLGQRRGDLVRLPVVRVQEGVVRLTQRKRGARIAVPLTPRLALRLEAAAKRRKALDPECPTVLIDEATKRPYAETAFSRAFAEVRALAVAGDAEKRLAPCPSLADALFLDSRDTAVTRLAEAGCTIPEIAAITGHSLRSIYEILKHYLDLTGEMASSAIAKLVAHQNAAGEASGGERNQSEVGQI